MKTYEPRDLGDCIVMSETEGGGWCKAEDVAELVASHRRLVEAIKKQQSEHDKYVYGRRDNAAYRAANDRIKTAIAEAEEILK